MKHKIEIRPRAAMDIFEGYDRYESMEKGLGDEYLQELETLFNDMLDNPFTYSYYDTPIRQADVNRFPYTVYFDVLIESIIIYGVFMTHQAYQKKSA